MRNAEVRYRPGIGTVAAADDMEPRSCSGRWSGPASGRKWREKTPPLPQDFPTGSKVQRQPSGPEWPRGAKKRGWLPGIIGSGGAEWPPRSAPPSSTLRPPWSRGAEVVGGICVNIGYIPSKYLVQAVHHYHTGRTVFPGIEP